MNSSLSVHEVEDIDEEVQEPEKVDTLHDESSEKEDTDAKTE